MTTCISYSVINLLIRLAFYELSFLQRKNKEIYGVKRSTLRPILRIKPWLHEVEIKLRCPKRKLSHLGTS